MENLRQTCPLKFYEWCELTAAAVIDGEAYALTALAELNDMAQAIASAQEQVKEYAMKEAAAYDKNKFTFAGRTFTKVPARRMVKYDHVPQWASLKARQERIEKLALTAATQFGATIVDEETGEVIPAAEIKYTKESLSVKPTK